MSAEKYMKSCRRELNKKSLKALYKWIVSELCCVLALIVAYIYRDFSYIPIVICIINLIYWSFQLFLHGGRLLYILELNKGEYFVAKSLLVSKKESYKDGLLYQLCTFENDLVYEDYADVLSLNKEYILCVRKDELENNENDLYWEPFVVSVNELNVLD